jgi:hypothetical protein
MMMSFQNNGRSAVMPALAVRFAHDLSALFLVVRFEVFHAILEMLADVWLLVVLRAVVVVLAGMSGVTVLHVVLLCSCRPLAAGAWPLAGSAG